MSDQASLATFEAFAAAERGKALKYATAWVGAEAAQDIVQDGLLVVWKKWETLTNPAAYLYRTCRQLAFAEYETRSRGPALLAELPEPRLTPREDETRDELSGSPDMLNLLELKNQNWSFPYTTVVGLALAEGFSRAEIADIIGIPLSEVHRSARELRYYYKARRDNPEPTAKEAAYTPHGLVVKAMRRLSRREREVMALAALGLKPQRIGPLIGITEGSARTTLCHARKAVATTAGLSMDKDMAKSVDVFVQATLGNTELLGLLPSFPWKAKALRLAEPPEWKVSNLLPSNPVWGSLVVSIPNFLDWCRAAPTEFHVGGRPPGLLPYLAETSKVMAVARGGLENSLAVSYGSVRWLPFGIRFRARLVGEPLVYAAAYRRLQATDNPAAWSRSVLAGRENMVVDVPYFPCSVPSWPARPPRYLVPAPHAGESRPFNVSFSDPKKSVKESFVESDSLARMIQDVRSTFATAA